MCSKINDLYHFLTDQRRLNWSCNCTLQSKSDIKCSFCRYRMFMNEDVTIGVWMLAMDVEHEDNRAICDTSCNPTSIAVWDLPRCSGMFSFPVIEHHCDLKSPSCIRCVIVNLPGDHGLQCSQTLFETNRNNMSSPKIV